MKIADMHCDTISVLRESLKKGEKVTLLQNTGQLDLQRMKKSGYLLQNFALFVDKEACTDPWEEMLAQYQVYKRELEAAGEWIHPVLCYEDIAANEEKGKLSAVLTVEEGAVCGGSIERLQQLYRMGVRMLTLTWNYPNELGWPNLSSLRIREIQAGGGSLEELFTVPETSRGLTERGREFVAEMERLGMIVDVSHLSDRGFYDVLECTHRPFTASHSNARAVCSCVRNLTDDMICRLGERGGCIGLNYCVDFLLEHMGAGQAFSGEILEAFGRHARHITDVGGIEVLGLGSDFDGIDRNEALPGAQSLEVLWEALHRAGFREGELDKIFYGNVLRIYRECWSL